MYDVQLFYLALVGLMLLPSVAPIHLISLGIEGPVLASPPLHTRVEVATKPWMVHC